MTLAEKQQTMFVGVDVHKDSHTAVAVSPFGEKLFELTFGNYQKDFETLSSRIEKESKTLSPFFGLEDCSGYGERLSSFLAERYPVVQVHSTLVERNRKRQAHPEKSDSLDALGVAKVMMINIDSLPFYTVSEKTLHAKQIKALSHEREFLVAEQTRLKNQLHVLLHRIYNSEYTTYFKSPFSLKALKHWSRVRPSCNPVLIRSMKRKVHRLLQLRLELKEIENDMTTLMNEAGITLSSASGCGTVLAATIIGEICDINRFKTPAALAKYAGCAPRQCSSGKTTRWRKTKSGNRRLTTAFHRMALSQISRMGNDKARAYFKKKVSEGKSKSQALVCLRRHMVTIIWMMLKHGTTFNIHYND